jgi:glutamine amidotransferase
MIAIIDYQAGNLRSIRRALEAAGEQVVVTDDPAVVAAADAVVLPGVGAAGHAMERLDAMGMVSAIHQAVDAGKPFLGICLGMQLLFDRQTEGTEQGLGLLKGLVREIREADKVPHMGWNRSVARQSFGDTAAGDEQYFYFVHSFIAEPDDPADIAATTEYGETFPSVVVHDRVWGMQFHPEKSGDDGLELIGAWVAAARAAKTGGRP